MGEGDVNACQIHLSSGSTSHTTVIESSLSSQDGDHLVRPSKKRMRIWKRQMAQKGQILYEDVDQNALEVAIQEKIDGSALESGKINPYSYRGRCFIKNNQISKKFNNQSDSSDKISIHDQEELTQYETLLRTFQVENQDQAHQLVKQLKLVQGSDDEDDGGRRADSMGTIQPIIEIKGGRQKSQLIHAHHEQADQKNQIASFSFEKYIENQDHFVPSSHISDRELDQGDDDDGEDIIEFLSKIGQEDEDKLMHFQEHFAKVLPNLEQLGYSTKSANYMEIPGPFALGQIWRTELAPSGLFQPIESIDDNNQIKTISTSELKLLELLVPAWNALFKILFQSSSLVSGTPAYGQNMIIHQQKTLIKILKRHQYKKKALNEDAPMDAINMTSIQMELFKSFSTFSDVLYASRNITNGPEIITIYTLYILNHLTKATTILRRHQAKLQVDNRAKSAVRHMITKLKSSDFHMELSESMVYSSEFPSSMKWKKVQLAGSEEDEVERENYIHHLKAYLDRPMDEDQLRDQGFTRPRVLVLLPMRNSAYNFVSTLIALSPVEVRNNVANKKKFVEEFGGDYQEPRGQKPFEWFSLFSGNTGDSFRLGIGIGFKRLSLYRPFYQSDIIVASPLSLKMTIEEQKDVDYLSSIELVIVDQFDVLLMQNWQHVKYIFEYLNVLPKKTEHTDFSRVRNYFLNQQGRYYRQTLMFGSGSSIEINSLFNRMTFSRWGKYKMRFIDLEGMVKNVTTAARQVFYRLDVIDEKHLDESRFQYFIQNVYVHLKNSVSNGTLIFIPSYLDYVRLRNFFKRAVQVDDINVLTSTEYTSDKELARNETFFKDGRAPIMLYTERLHFYKRQQLKSVQNIIFYSPPFNAHYYSECINRLAPDGSSLLIYTKYDCLKMEQILGKSRTMAMIKSKKTTHAIMM